MRPLGKIRFRGTGSERGASAVEFALVVPLLLTLLAGIMDYGLWFNESLNVRQGVREAARAAVVQDFDEPGCTGSQLVRLVCKTKAEIRPLNGQAYVRVVVPPTGWVRGEPLLLCGLVKVDGLTGLAPLPSGQLVRSATHMSIENTTTPSTMTAGPHGDAAPAGSSWSWCV